MVQVNDARRIARCITLGLAANEPSVALSELMIAILKYGNVRS